MASGFIWNVGHCCSVFATLYIGIAYGYPLAQTCIFVSGVWGILIFQEIQNQKSIGLFSFSALIMIGGASLLAIAHG